MMRDASTPSQPVPEEWLSLQPEEAIKAREAARQVAEEAEFAPVKGADPALAAKVVDVLINDYHHNWHPRYDDLARSMSANWTDSGKRARFVARFVERQAQEDADIATADAEAPPIADDGMYNHL